MRLIKDVYCNVGQFWKFSKLSHLSTEKKERVSNDAVFATCNPVQHSVGAGADDGVGLGTIDCEFFSHIYLYL